MFVTPENMGWGNVTMCLTDYVYHNIHSATVYKPTFTDAVQFKLPVNLVDTLQEPVYTPRIVINSYFIEQIHSKMSDIFEPSPKVQELIDTYKHLVDGCVAGMHIRRGAFSEDSSKMGCHGTDKPAYFANDKALHDFKNITIKQTHIFPYKIEEYKNYVYEKKDYFKYMPQELFDCLEKNLGWHLCITCNK